MHTNANWLQALVLLIGFCRFVFSMYFQFQCSCFYLKFLFIKCIRFSAEDQSSASINLYRCCIFIFNILYLKVQRSRSTCQLWALVLPIGSNGDFPGRCIFLTWLLQQQKLQLNLKIGFLKTTKSATRSTNWVFKNNKKCN